MTQHDTSRAAAFSLEPYFEVVRQTELTPPTGRVVRVVGLVIESLGPHARVGEWRKS